VTAMTATYSRLKSWIHVNKIHRTKRLSGETDRLTIFCLAATRKSLKRKTCRSFRSFAIFSTIRPCFTRYRWLSTLTHSNTIRPCFTRYRWLSTLTHSNTITSHNRNVFCLFHSLFPLVLTHVRLQPEPRSHVHTLWYSHTFFHPVCPHFFDHTLWYSYKTRYYTLTFLLL